MNINYYSLLSTVNSLDRFIIIIWHYNPLWGFRLLSQVSPSSSILSCLLPVFDFQLFRSSMTSSCHRCPGLPTGLVPIGFQSSSFPVGLAWSILWICPRHLILCALMNLIISAPSIKLSVSVLFRILHTLSILTGPNIFLNICLSNMRRFFHLLLLKSKCLMSNLDGLLSILIDEYLLSISIFWYRLLSILID